VSLSALVRRGFIRIRQGVPCGIPPIRAAAICAALFACTPQAFASPPATNTALAITSNGSPVTTLIQGNLVTLTASVTSSGTPLTVGQVEFCDASAPYCTDIHQLALAQLTSAGTATFHFVPPAGNRSYKAVFLGTNNYASSTSSPQNLAVTPSGFNIEIGFGGKSIDDERWEVRTYDAASVWGHRRPVLAQPPLSTSQPEGLLR